MTDQRRLDGVQQAPVRVKEKVPECVDCGIAANHIAVSRERWPDGKVLRHYPADNEHSCKPCADGSDAHPQGGG